MTTELAPIVIFNLSGKLDILSLRILSSPSKRLRTLYAPFSYINQTVNKQMSKIKIKRKNTLQLYFNALCSMQRQ